MGLLVLDVSTIAYSEPRTGSSEYKKINKLPRQQNGCRLCCDDLSRGDWRPTQGTRPWQ
jgi:hypothetical protein